MNRKLLLIPLLDSENNKFSEEFRRDLIKITGGHPLFTVELLREFEAQNYIRKDKEGYWVITEEISQFNLPFQVEGIIAERIRNVPKELQEILTIASIEGEIFPAELIAKVQNKDLWQTVKALNSLDKEHHLIKQLDFREVADKRLSRYAFRHQLFQKYIYQQLCEAEQVLLHGRVANTLTTLLPQGPSEFSSRLAQHFQIASEFAKALKHWQDAAQYAEQLAAYLEATNHVQQALKLLNNLPKEQSLPIELSLHLKLGELFFKVKGWAAPEVEQAFSKAHTLCKQLNQSAELAPALLGLCTYYQHRADYQTSIELGEQMLSMVQHNPKIPLLILPIQGWNYFFQGNFIKAKGVF